MENRKSEIDNIVPSFTASMMDLISRHRQKRDAVNQVPGFIEAVERERERMTAKFKCTAQQSGLRRFSPRDSRRSASG